MKELALHIMDVMQNSITAESSEIAVSLTLSEDDSRLTIRVEDNGYGMDEETLRKATDPFHTSKAARMVGLGLPMLKEATHLTGGDFSLESEQGVGTVLTAEFINHSLDRQPLGDLGNVFFLTMLSHEALNLKLTLSSEKGTFFFESRRFASFIKRHGGSQMDAAFRAETFINEQVRMLFKEALPEMGGGLHGIERDREADKRETAGRR